MPSFLKNHLASVVAVIILFALGCQSAQERQANELRNFLRGEIIKFDSLNQQVIAEKQKLYEIDSTSPFADVEETRQEHQREIADLRKKIEDYPDLELTSLAEQVRHLIKRRQQDAESVARWRRDAARHAEIQAMFDANAARDREALRPKIIQGGRTITVPTRPATTEEN